MHPVSKKRNGSNEKSRTSTSKLCKIARTKKIIHILKNYIRGKTQNIT